MAEHRDLLGQDINVGDYIVYAAIDGQSATMRVGHVLALKPDGKVFTKSWSNFECRGPFANNREHKDGYYVGSGRQKNVTLSFMDRMTVVPAEMVHEKIKADLDGPIWESRWNEKLNDIEWIAK